MVHEPSRKCLMVSLELFFVTFKLFCSLISFQVKLSQDLPVFKVHVKISDFETVPNSNDPRNSETPVF